jgi:hypothetical protein
VETENVEIKKGCYKHLFILLGAIIGAVILLSVCVISSIMTQNSQMAQRRHLFCEEIKIGMSETEVLHIMGKFGEFGITKFESGENTKIEVQPVVSDTTSKKYGIRGLELNFEKGLLINVIERRHLEDGVYALCK